jgi:hypothetical protein
MGAISIVFMVVGAIMIIIGAIMLSKSKGIAVIIANKKKFEIALTKDEESKKSQGETGLGLMVLGVPFFIIGLASTLISVLLTPPHLQ